MTSQLLTETNLAALNRANNGPIMTPPSVLVLGAGELGLAVLTALAAHPMRPRVATLSVLLRQATLDSAAPAKKRTIQHIRTLGAGFDAADVVAASVEELADIMARYDTVVSCCGMELPKGTQTKLAEAALKAGVRRYFPWQFGMDYDVIGKGSAQDLFDEQLEVRRVLRAQSATEWTIVSTGLFMSFLFEPAFGVVELDSRTVRALGRWDNEITLTTPGDIGRVTAEMVLDPRGEGVNGVVYTAGDTISYARLADLLDERFGGEKLTRELWDEETLAKQLEAEPDSVMAKYRGTFARGKGVAWGVEGTVNAKRGMKMVDVREYLKDVQLSVAEKES
ncbi:NmrA family protein [Purpureocillium lilacinum]|uniref:NmrA family protein n=1 Tax=Purpureocillium lilacinum TaxID=33203 RepID=A0A179HGF6_PURLI|nr:NmrA family protein [Purpureocillium lilacinum]OAQ89486.1 NmrA family protein [Purpureocillium lilacinum]